MALRVRALPFRGVIDISINSSSTEAGEQIREGVILVLPSLRNFAWIYKQCIYPPVLLLTPPFPSTTDISLFTAVRHHDGCDGYASGYCQLLSASSSAIIKLFNDFDARELSAAICCFWLPSPADRHWVVITKIDRIRQSRQPPCC
jgi:hypothetical protein